MPVWEDTHLDLDDGRGTRNGVEFALTGRECEAVRYLIEHAGDGVSRETLELDVWKFEAGVRSQTVPVTLRKIRSKLGAAVLDRTHSGDWCLQPPDQASGMPEYAAPYFRRASVETTVAERFAAGWRLVTLVGQGGCGKTRVACAIASSEPAVWFVDLHGIKRVQRAFGRCLGLGRWGVRDIQRALERRNGLLVVDGFGGCRDQVAPLLAGLKQGSGMRVLLTARSALGSPGESVVPVPVFGVEEAQRFLQQRLVVPADRQARELVAVALGGLPGALEWVSRLPGGLPRVEQLEASAGPALRHLIEPALEALSEPARALARALVPCRQPLQTEVLVRWRGEGVVAALQELLREALVEPTHGAWRLAAVPRVVLAAEPDSHPSWWEWLGAELESLDAVFHRDPERGVRRFRELEMDFVQLVDVPEMGERAAPILLILLDDAGPRRRFEEVAMRFHRRFPANVAARVFRAAIDCDAAAMPQDPLPPRIAAYRYAVRAVRWWQTPVPQPPSLVGWPEDARLRVEMCSLLRAPVDPSSIEAAHSVMQRAEPWGLMHLKSLLLMGQVHGRLGLLHVALQYFDRGEKTAKVAELWSCQATSLDAFATFLVGQDPGVALEAWRRLQELSALHGDTSGEWTALSCQAICHCLLNAPQEALDLLGGGVLLGALPIPVGVGVKVLRAGLLAELGALDGAQQEMAEAAPLAAAAKDSSLDQVVDQGYLHIEAAQSHTASCDFDAPQTLVARAQQVRILRLISRG